MSNGTEKVTSLYLHLLVLIGCQAHSYYGIS